MAHRRPRTIVFLLPAILIVFLLSPANARLQRVDITAMPKAAPISNGADGQVVFAQVLWRHGDRSPKHHFPNDKVPESHWTQGGGGLGQLTPEGMKQHVELGQKLRARYNELVSARYTNGEIYVHSTDVNRTIVSAISNMIGFYSAGVAGEDFPSGLAGWPASFVPIPIHSSNLETDYVLGCPPDSKHAAEVNEKLRSTKEYTEAENSNKDFLSKLAGLMGVDEVPLSFVFSVYDTLFIQKIKGVEWPDGVDEQVFNETRDLAALVDDLNDGIGVAAQEGVDFGVELAKIDGGPLLTEMIERMQAKVRCLETSGKRSDKEKQMCAFFDPLKYYAYSAHDVTIAALFSTFGFKTTNYNESGLPHYAACAAVELLQSKGADDKNVYSIRVVYYPDRQDALDLTSAVSGCERGCTLDEFVARSKNFTDSDFVKYCEGANGAAVGLTATYTVVAFFLLIAQWILASRI
ncbi:Acid phosphatase [Aphelenchoides fujianensis]|nr:Acid phosphatase [Aphelenchoides fujianensis]